MVKQISLRTYESGRLWRVYLNKYEVVFFSTCFLSSVFIAFDFCVQIQKPYISINSKILTGTEKVIYFRPYADKDFGNICSVEIRLEKKETLLSPHGKSPKQISEAILKEID